MTIEKLIEDFCNTSTQSEAEVKTKFVNPLCEILEYSTDKRAEEFPVYGFDGRVQNNSKYADVLFFTSNDFTDRRSRSDDNKKWVHENSLLLVEVKKRGESIDVEDQAIYYAVWTRTPLYIVTNGEKVRFYKINANFSDELTVECDISKIPEYWDTIYDVFSYPKALLLKIEAAKDHLTKNDLYLDYCSNMIVELDLSLRRKLGRPLSISQANYFSPKLNSGTHKMIDYKDIFCQNNSAVIVSEPGVGKSYLLSMIAGDALLSTSEIKKVPIIIQCGYFNFAVTDIGTAVYNALLPFSPNITLSIVNRDIKNGKFILLFDALDEFKGDKGVLTRMIINVIASSNCKVAVTERTVNHNDDFSAISTKYELLPLDEELVVQYIKENTNGKYNYFSLSLDLRFRKLLARPLFLFVFVEILNSQSGKIPIVPKNTAMLYDNYIKYSLRRKNITDTEISIVVQILSNYAEWLMSNQESDAELIKFIQNTAGTEQTEKYMEIIVRSDITVQGLNGLHFFHNTFQEYFFAKRIVQYSENEITDFLYANQNDEKFYEIICFMVGIISSENRQNLVLDYLQKRNLKLFIRAIKSRYKLDTNQIDKEYEYSYTYFNQIRNTYIEVIDTFFVKIKNLFFPFKWIHDKNSK